MNMSISMNIMFKEIKLKSFLTLNKKQLFNFLKKKPKIVSKFDEEIKDPKISSEIKNLNIVGEFLKIEKIESIQSKVFESKSFMIRSWIKFLLITG